MAAPSFGTRSLMKSGPLITATVLVQFQPGVYTDAERNSSRLGSYPRSCRCNSGLCNQSCPIGVVGLHVCLKSRRFSFDARIGHQFEYRLGDQSVAPIRPRNSCNPVNLCLVGVLLCGIPSLGRRPAFQAVKIGSIPICRSIPHGPCWQGSKTVNLVVSGSNPE